MNYSQLELAFQHIVKSLNQDKVIDPSLRRTDPQLDRGRIASLLANSSLDILPQEQNRIVDEFLNWGPLHQFIGNSNITEIICTQDGQIWIEQNGKLENTNEKFFSDLTYKNFVQRLEKDCRFTLNLDHPFANFQWQGYRGHITSVPSVKKNYVLHLRSISQTPWTLDRLHSLNWCTQEQLNQLKGFVKNKYNLFIVGSTGSGKTSALNALMHEIDTHERILMIEDTDELHCPNQISTKLLTRQDASGVLTEIDQSELVRQSLRMRPDRIIMGEARGQEAKDLLLALATGHRGSMGTLHADTAQQAIMRLEMLTQMGAPQWSLQTIRRLMSVSIDVIIVVEKTPAGERKIKSIHQVAGYEENGLLLQDTQQFALRSRGPQHN